MRKQTEAGRQPSKGLSHLHKRIQRFGTKWQLFGSWFYVPFGTDRKCRKAWFCRAGMSPRRCGGVPFRHSLCHRQFRRTWTLKVEVVALHAEEKNGLAGSLLKLIHLFRAVPRFQWLERLVLIEMRLACDGITWRRTRRPDHQRSRARNERVNDRDREISAEATLPPPASSGVGPRLSSSGEPAEFAATRTGSWFLVMIAFSLGLASLA